ncbi:MAG: ABC transporter substrate-binding protein [Actinomycetota bacterium]
MTRRTVLAGLVAFAFLAAACGQYSGVHQQAVAQGQTTGALAGSVTEGSTSVGDTALADTTGSGGGAQSGGGVTSGSGESTGSGASVPTTGDSTGVTDTTITIAIHAPLTGAAPLRAESFNRGKDLYWQKGNNGKPVLIEGRQVKVVFSDDQYNPSHARDVCQQMAEQQNAFLLIGGGGTDQIQACAQYSASRGIPYLSAGVTEIGMRSLPNYFALSMSYAQQGTLLAQYVKKVLKVTDASRVALVHTDTPNFDDAVDAFTNAFPGVTVFRPAKNERGSSMAGNLCTGPQKNFDVVYPLVAPSYYLEMAGAAKCNPQYAGVGISIGIDQVANLGCQSGGTEGARFFSPAPAFADSDDFDPAFRQAGGEDDIEFLLWSLSKVLHQVLQNAFDLGDGTLTREGFIAATEQSSFKTGLYPDIAYTLDDHFGAKQVHVLRNVCEGGGGHYVTEAAFKDSF